MKPLHLSLFDCFCQRFYEFEYYVHLHFWMKNVLLALPQWAKWLNDILS